MRPEYQLRPLSYYSDIIVTRMLMDYLRGQSNRTRVMARDVFTKIGYLAHFLVSRSVKS